jgi:hypothetical protein
MKSTEPFNWRSVFDRIREMLSGEREVFENSAGARKDGGSGVASESSITGTDRRTASICYWLTQKGNGII